MGDSTCSDLYKNTDFKGKLILGMRYKNVYLNASKFFFWLNVLPVAHICSIYIVFIFSF